MKNLHKIKGRTTQKNDKYSKSERKQNMEMLRMDGTSD